MELQIGVCNDCDRKLPIVNRRYCLCDGCNFKRLHDGKTKEEVYRERAKGKQAIIERSVPDLSRIKGVTKASALKSISSDPKFLCTDGSRVSQVTIKRKYAEVCDRIKQTRDAVCQGSGRGDVPLSFSHTISQARCKDLGKTELIWDEENIEVEGFEAPTSKPLMAHNIWEVGTLEMKIMLLNFERKLEYIKQHDSEDYNRYMVKLDELERKLDL